MDPVSISASLVTLLAAGAASCRFVYEFVRGISDGPLEINSQAAKLKCLLQSMSDIVDVYTTLSSELNLEPQLELQIRRAIRDIRATETRIRIKSLKLADSRLQNFRERCLFLSTDRRIKKLYSSLDQWNNIFSQATSTVQMLVYPPISQTQ